MGSRSIRLPTVPHSTPVYVQFNVRPITPAGGGGHFVAVQRPNPQHIPEVLPGLPLVFCIGGENQHHALVKPVLFHALTPATFRSEEHTSELQSRENLVCRLL